MSSSHHHDEPDATSVDFWEASYAERDLDWGINPNAQLLSTLEKLLVTPGTALDLGCGHGGDAIWMATQGWKVTAIDVSATAVERVKSAALRAGYEDRVDAQAIDLAEELPEGPFDLIYACYFQSPVEFDRDGALARVAELIAPAGHLVVIDHGEAPPWSDAKHHPEMFRSPEQTLADIGLSDGWETVVCEKSEHDAVGPEGEDATLVDNVMVFKRA